MKVLWLAIVLLLLFLNSGCNQQPATPPAATKSAANQSAPPANDSAAKHGSTEFSPNNTNTSALDEITTRNGTRYRNVTVQRVDPDGLTISYAPVGGGMGAAKLKFENLPDDLQQRYGYDTNKAAAYRAQQAQAMAEWRAEQQAAAETARSTAMQQATPEAVEQQSTNP